MHDDGEEDLRGTYCAIVIAKLCNLEKLEPSLFENSYEWVLRFKWKCISQACMLFKLNFKNNRCQTYEGGFGATPGNEAHGGYSFCGLASLKLLNKERMCDIDSLTVINFFLLPNRSGYFLNFICFKQYWLVNKQMKFEGGFQGRTNKLVDSCYSFWQAGMFPIIHSILMKGWKTWTKFFNLKIYNLKCFNFFIIKTTIF